MDALGDEVIGQADDLVRQEAIGSRDDPASAGLGRKPASDLGASLIESRAEQGGRLCLELLGWEALQLVGQRPAVDDRAPVGNQRESRRLLHPSAASRFSA